MRISFPLLFRVFFWLSMYVVVIGVPLPSRPYPLSMTGLPSHRYPLMATMAFSRLARFGTVSRCTFAPDPMGFRRSLICSPGIERFTVTTCTAGLFRPQS
jgi:hypothetical protein